MARERVWTTRSIQLVNQPDGAVSTLLTDVDVGVGATVVRVVGAVQVGWNPSTSPTFPQVIRAGIAFGPAPLLADLVTDPVPGDWLWLGSETVWTPAETVSTNPVFTHPAGVLGRVDSEGARIVGPGDGVHLVVRRQLTSGESIQIVALLRVLTLASGP